MQLDGLRAWAFTSRYHEPLGSIDHGKDDKTG